MSDEDLNRTRDDWVSENALLGAVELEDSLAFKGVDFINNAHSNI